MGRDLCWEIVRPKQHATLSSCLKAIISEHYELEKRKSVRLGEDDIYYLQGVADACSNKEAREDAKMLITELRSCEEIEIYLGNG